MSVVKVDWLVKSDFKCSCVKSIHQHVYCIDLWVGLKPEAANLICRMEVTECVSQTVP